MVLNSIRLTSKGHIAQDDFCLTLGTEQEVLEGLVNQEILAKMNSNNETSRTQKMLYIIPKLCIEEGENELQLWERYRPAQKVTEILKLVYSLDKVKFYPLRLYMYTILFLIIFYILGL